MLGLGLGLGLGLPLPAAHTEVFHPSSLHRRFMSDSSDDDDAPPPLADMSTRLSIGQAQRLRHDQVEAAAAAKRAAQPPQAKPKPMAKGFFDAPPPKPKTKQKAKKQVQAAEQADDGVEIIRPNKAATSSPFQVDATDDRASAFKAAVTDALKPTQETLSEVMGNTSLMEGFDDPEVMAAVADIAKDARNMKKYANNEKVQRFYKAMAGQVASKFDSMAEGEESQKQQQQASARKITPLIAPAKSKAPKAPAQPAQRKGTVDYSRWDDLDLSDDEDHEATFQKAEFRRLQEQAYHDKQGAAASSSSSTTTSSSDHKDNAKAQRKATPSAPASSIKPDVTLPSVATVAAERRRADAEPDDAWTIKPVAVKKTNQADVDASPAPPPPAAAAAGGDLFDMD